MPAEESAPAVLNCVKTQLRWQAENGTEGGQSAAVSAAIAKVCAAIEEELFQWEEVAIELPDSAFTNIRPSASYTAPQEGQLSPKEDGQQRMPENKRYALFPELSSHKREAPECLELGGAQLSPDQLESIWRTGSFEVASERYPGKVHRWRVNPLIAEGLDNLKDHFAQRCANALQHVRYGIVDRLTDPNGLSLLHAVKRIGNTVTSAGDALIGIPAFHHQTSQTAELAKAKVRFLVLDFYDAIAAEAVDHEEYLSLRCVQQEYDFYRDEARGVYPRNVGSGDDVPSALDLRLWLGSDSYAASIRLSAVQPLLDQIQREFPQRSREIVDDFIATGGAAEEGLSEEEAHSRLQTYCEAVLMSEIEEKLAGLAEFSSASGSTLLERIVAALKVNILRNAVCVEVERERLAITSQVRERLQEEHVILSKIGRWLDSETDREMRRLLGIPADAPLQQHWNLVLERRLIEGLEALHDPRLAQDILLLKRGLQWEEEHAEAAAAELAEESKVPGYQRTFKRWWWDSKISAFGCPTEGTDIPTSSSFFGWRLHMLGAGTIDLTSRMAIASLNTMFWSSFSMRALLLCEEFKHPLSPRHQPATPTYRSRLKAAFARHTAAIARFESEPDTGMLGKGVSRLFQRLFSGLFLCVSVALIGLLWPPLCVTATLVSGAVAVTSPVIASGACLSVYGFGLVRSLVVTALNVAVLSPLEAATSVLGAAVYHPMCATLIQPMAVAKFSFGYLYYSLCQKVIGSSGKVPRTDSFAARRVAGPGLSFKTYKKSSLPAALAVVRVKLEELELDLIEKTALQTARQPLTLFERTVKKVVQPFASSVTPHNRFIANESAVVSAMIESACQKRRQELPRVVPTSGYPVRLEPDDYDTLLDVSTTLVQEFFEKRIFGDVFRDNEVSIAEFWADRGLSAGAFEEMAKALLVAGLGPDILQPLTEEDCSVELRVEEVPGMRRFLSLTLRTKKPLNPLGATGVTIKRAMKAKGPVCRGFATFPMDKNSQGLQPKQLVTVKAPHRPPVARRARPSQAEYEGLLTVRE